MRLNVSYVAQNPGVADSVGVATMGMTAGHLPFSNRCFTTSRLKEGVRRNT
jgi:hypothetical protein